jgi:hypothetical protein
VFSTYVEAELGNTSNTMDIRPQLLLGAQIATIILRMLNKEKAMTQTVFSQPGRSDDQKQPDLNDLHNNYRQQNEPCKELLQNEATCRRMFGIKNELALRINISLMCLAVATGDLTCMGTIDVTEAVITAVHTLLNKLREWLATTEGYCGIVFAQTQLALYKCVCMEGRLASQLRDHNPEHSHMVREISSSAEQVLRSLSTRFALAKMLLLQLSSTFTSAQPLTTPLKRNRASSSTSNDGEKEDDCAVIKAIMRLYSQSCRRISSFAKARQPLRSMTNLTGHPHRRNESSDGSNGSENSDSRNRTALASAPFATAAATASATAGGSAYFPSSPPAAATANTMLAGSTIETEDAAAAVTDNVDVAAAAWWPTTTTSTCSANDSSFDVKSPKRSRLED